CRFRRGYTAHIYRCKNKKAQCPYQQFIPASAHYKTDIGLCDIIISHDRRKRKKEKGNRHKTIAYHWKMPCYRKLRIFGACLYLLSEILHKKAPLGISDVILPGKQDHECRCRTYKKRIHIHRKPLHQSLLNGMTNRCCRSSMGCRSLSGFVAVNA